MRPPTSDGVKRKGGWEKGMEEGSVGVSTGEVVVVRPTALPVASPPAGGSRGLGKPTITFDREHVTAVRAHVQGLLARQPALTLGGAFVLGVLLGRLV